MLTFIRLFLCLFAVLTLVGGIVGFAKARSKASLIAGGVAAALLLASAWLTGTGIMFIRVMAGRTTTAAALLVNRSNVSDPTVVELRMDGRVFAYQVKFKDPPGKQHILKVPSEQAAKEILSYAMGTPQQPA